MPKKALFLDRDGVINIDHGYVHKQEDFEFVNGIFELCQAFQQDGYLIFVITNQAGIGREFYTESDFQILSDWMVKQFEQSGVTINHVYYCPHHPTEAKGHFLKECNCRKPMPGMILRAKDEWDLDLTHSVFIGDKMSDMQAALNAGVGRKVLLSSRFHEKESHLEVEHVESLSEIPR